MASEQRGLLPHAREPFGESISIRGTCFGIICTLLVEPMCLLDDSPPLPLGHAASSAPRVATEPVLSAASASAPLVVPPTSSRSRYGTMIFGHAASSAPRVATESVLPAASASAPLVASTSTSTSTGLFAPGFAALLPEEDRIDPLCRRTQMVLLMNKNDSRANTDSFSATVAKSVLDFIMGRKTSILETVQRGDPQLHAGMEKAIDAPLSHPPGSRPGKFHRIEKLVDIWMVFKQVDTLLSDTGGHGQLPLRHSSTSWLGLRILLLTLSKKMCTSTRHGNQFLCQLARRIVVTWKMVVLSLTLVSTPSVQTKIATTLSSINLPEMSRSLQTIYRP